MVNSDSGESSSNSSGGATPNGDPNSVAVVSVGVATSKPTVVVVSSPPPVVTGAAASVSSSAHSVSFSAISSGQASSVAASASAVSRHGAASPSIPKKVMSKNHNNTLFPTTFPSNLAELQLYRVMQNASLLYYYDTLLEMGGDDVQQLCDAGEEEFLEIMSLVGMASKPLHVRRLQKSLHEWVNNPAKFKIPLIPGDDFEIELSSPRVTGSYYVESNNGGDAGATRVAPAFPDSAVRIGLEDNVRVASVSPGLCVSNKRPYSPIDTPSCPPSSSSSPGSTFQNNSTPVLLESQIAILAAAAERLSKHLPQFEPKPQNAKKKMCKELELVMSMPETDPRRMDEIRRYAAIYGRFDCKRRPEKPLTLHEVSVNEAAAQICRYVPALLTRRDELFPLARQVVKDSGCHYSKTHFAYNKSSHDLIDIITSNSAPHALNNRGVTRLSSVDSESSLHHQKRQKFDSDLDSGDDRHQQELTEASIRSIYNRHRRRDSHGGLPTDDETDSRFSFSNSSSPPLVLDDRNDEEKYHNTVQVVAASGDNIIAVANPALAMSTAILPLALDTRERT